MIDLPLVWAIIIASAVLAYALLDGFDLGVGILFPFFNDQQKGVAVHTIAPIWDGNETWLVLGGGGLLAAFPLAYSSLLSAFYAPVIAMLLALVFRGVSLEYREKTKRGRFFWDTGFWLGSVVAAFCQGVMLGAFIQGVDVTDRVYSGGWFDWLTPYSITCGIAIVSGYALLGGTWITMKTHGLAERITPLLLPMVGTVFFFIALISSWTPFLDDRLTERWFALPNFIWLTPIPLLVVGVTLLLVRAVQTGAEQKSFYLAEALFVVTFIGFGISTYPYIVPHGITIWDAAAPDSSLSFLLVGTVVLLPLIIIYTVHSYWVFRGKVHDESSYLK